MGQKVNPVGLRIGVNKNWNSRWYANDNEFHVFLNEDIKDSVYKNKRLLIRSSAFCKDLAK